MMLSFVARRAFPALVSACALLCSVAAQAASAVTVRVDDDRAECPNAEFLRISDALKAVAPGSTVVVCPGTYFGPLRMNKAGVRVIGLPGRHADIVLQTARGKTLGPLVTMSAPATRLAAIKIRDNPLQAFNGRCFQTGVLVDNGAGPFGEASIIDNVTVRHHVGSQSDCPAEEGGTGVMVGDEVGEPGRAIVRNSTILARGAGVEVNGDSRARIDHNVIANPGNSSQSNGAVFVRSGTATITSNDLSGYFFGVLIPAGQAAVLSNTVHDNLTGVEVGNFSGAGGAGTATVVNNDIHHNALFGGGRGGVEVSSDGSIVSANRVHDNAGHGISVTPTASGNQILANVATNNDCSDSSTGNATAGTANTWLNNIGPSSFPPGICLPPGP